MNSDFENLKKENLCDAEKEAIDYIKNLYKKHNENKEIEEENRCSFGKDELITTLFLLLLTKKSNKGLKLALLNLLL
ncbi:MAG: hypothetical protein LBT82_03595 [Oscillospiraceae bacterium]|jgi:hypothetical protein|nr:hypothetical protein [Oscillospiraceae bacterium]